MSPRLGRPEVPDEADLLGGREHVGGGHGHPGRLDVDILAVHRCAYR